MCWTENCIIGKSPSIKIKSQNRNCWSMAEKPFDDHRVRLHAFNTGNLEAFISHFSDSSPAKQSYLFSEALRKMLKSNHVQQSTEKHMFNCQGDISICQQNALLNMDELL